MDAITLLDKPRDLRLQFRDPVQDADNFRIELDHFLISAHPGTLTQAPIRTVTENDPRGDLRNVIEGAFRLSLPLARFCPKPLSSGHVPHAPGFGSCAVADSAGDRA